MGEIRTVRDYLDSDIEVSPFFESPVKINSNGCMFYSIHRKPNENSPRAYLCVRPIRDIDDPFSEKEFEPVEVLLRQHLEDIVVGNGKVST